MLTLPGAVRIYVCREPVDFRKSHDGLCGVVRNHLEGDPFTGDLFIFFNRTRDRIKLLLWDRNGFWLFYKRLEKGTFSVDLQGPEKRLELSRAQLAMILEGIDWKSAKIRSNFRDSVRIRTRERGSEPSGRSGARLRELQGDRARPRVGDRGA